MNSRINHQMDSEKLKRYNKMEKKNTILSGKVPKAHQKNCRKRQN
jgi:hypothetical protein